MITMDEVRNRLRLNAGLAERALALFIRDAVETAGAEGVVLGLSGGVDSALAAALAAKALGPKAVYPFLLPHRISDPQSLEHAEEVAQVFDLDTRTIDISPMVDPYFERYEPEADQVRRGNKMARERMGVLFDQSKKLRSLVLGTSNKTEILLGYSTIFGDNASSINPLGDLYKQQVWQLSRHVGVPAEVIDKKPSADLWQGQTDEDELGFDYATADEVLYLMFDLGLSPDEVIARGYAEESVSKITLLEQRNRYKRRLMLIARLSGSAINLDREIPRD
ncbi:MAG: NAD+ synthase [Thermoanaerobaculia bacterium]